ncbi:hypothetical protein VTL71DRAFT_7880 [Oculimacula yallundae]|uniref:ceramidase n=1 Tax=Oculimacula yallundae TaxID=86028 RepID=A0ABR4CWZ1_9HELO
MAPPEAPPEALPKVASKNASIPTYTIDLSEPPEERYSQLAEDFASEMKALTSLLDEVLQMFIPWRWARKFVEWLASLFLRRVYSAEETEELRGISKAAGIDMHFLVALNVLLDSLLGCTSGGIMTSLSEKSEHNKRMMHFRTLDWGMDALRSVLVILVFVNSDIDEDAVIGRSITYAGFVGTLTGVRKDLSVSLNFRPSHSCSTLSLRKHQLLVLLGYRPSIGSIIRSMIVPSEVEKQKNPIPLSDQLNTFPKLRCPPCYLVLCDGTRTAVVQRDLDSTKVRMDTECIIVTNHDTEFTSSKWFFNPTGRRGKSSLGIKMRDWVQDSLERSACVWRKWSGVKKRLRKQLLEDGAKSEDLEQGGWASVRLKTLEGWLKADPVMNECTHFMCVMDPKTGLIRFLERGPAPEDTESKS